MRIEPCILGTALVPWNDDYTFAEGIFRKHVQELISSGLKNLYVFGTAGEGYALTDDSFRTIASVFFEEMGNAGGLCHLGLIGLSTPQVKERIESGLELGFRMFQISLPSWGKLNDREMFGFFDDILGSYPEAQFLHYNTIRGLRKLSGADYSRICADHKNLAATKSGGGNILADLDLLTNAPELCHFMTEYDFAYSSLFGSVGFLISIASLNARRAQEFFRAGRERDVQTLVAMSRELYLAHELLFSTTTSGQHMDGAYDKIFSKSKTPEFPLRLLPPYQGTSDEEYAKFIAAMEKHLPCWCQ